MPKLITDNYDKWFTERKVHQMREVDRLLAMSETHYGLSLIGETRIEEMLRKWGEKTKEESSTSDQAEEILGETRDHLHDLDSRKPMLPDSHIGPALDREPQFPGR
jgi:hypothetical protein